MKSNKRFWLWLLVAPALLGVWWNHARLDNRDDRSGTGRDVSRLTTAPSFTARSETRASQGGSAGAAQTSPSGDDAAGGDRLPPEALVLIGSAWTAERGPEFDAFRDWTERYLASASDLQPGMADEGRALAATRRAALARLIASDPKAALAAAVPQTVRSRLPASVVELLEERVSGRGSLGLVAVLASPDQPPTEPSYHVASLAGKTYHTYTYGRRTGQTALAGASLLGVAVDGVLALSESPLRLLEPGETAGARLVDEVCSISNQATPPPPDGRLNTEAATAVEHDGKIEVLCSEAHVPALAANLVAAEDANPLWLAAGGGSGGPVIANTPTEPWTHGTKRVLAILIDFSDLPGPYPKVVGDPSRGMTTPAEILAEFGPIHDFYVDNSYGKTGIDADATAVLRLPKPTTHPDYYSYWEVTKDAYAAASAAGWNLADYDIIGVIAPRVARFGSFLGVAFVGPNPQTVTLIGKAVGTFYINQCSTFSILTHEIGHTYGLPHSNLWIEGYGSVEYGDNYDIMGGGHQPFHHFSHWNKAILHWIPPEAILSTPAAGVHRLHRFDHGDADLALARVLWFPRDATRSYWLGYRRALPDADLDGGAYVVQGYPQNRQGDLIRFSTPTTHVALQIGQTYTDYPAGVSLNPVAQGGTGAEEWLDVQVSYVTRFKWAQASYTVAEGNTVTLTVNREGSAGAASVNYTLVPNSALNPEDFTGVGGVLSWADGETAPKTITVATTRDYRKEFSEQFGVVLSGATVGGSATATVTINDGVAPVQTPAINGVVRRIVPTGDPTTGRFLVFGDFSSVADAAGVPQPRPGIARLNGDGSLDTSFSAGTGIGYGRVDAAAVQADGKIVIAGSFLTVSGNYRFHLARLNADGTLDTGFNPLPALGPNAPVRAILLQDVYANPDYPEQRIIIGGAFTAFNGVAREYLARLLPDGSLDTSFTGPNFSGTGGGEVNALVAHGYDDQVLVGGRFRFDGASKRSGLCRVGQTGSLDASFDGVVLGAEAARPDEPASIDEIVLDASWNILVAGRFSSFNGASRRGLARLSFEGELDASFAPEPNGRCSSILVLPNGDIAVGGAFNAVGGHPTRHIARLKANGQVDLAFSAAGGHGGSVYDLALRSDGLVLMGGVSAVFRTGTLGRPVWGWAP